MSTAAPEAPPEVVPPRRAGDPRPRPWRAALSRESVVVFGVSYAFYAVVGYLVMLQWNIVVGDGVSRLAHAYFVWYNEPPKLTAIGFVWPPLMTIVLLPLAVVKPVATSLLALPLTSAFFGAALVVVLDRTLVLLGMSRRARLPLVAAVALNPMIVYYAANGMGETLYLFLLTFAVYSFVRWYLDPRLHTLVFASLALTLGVLARYELVFWAIVVGVALIAVLVRRRAAGAQLEATGVAFFAPIAYGFGLWIFFNWLILGDPLHWLTSEVTLTFVETRVEAAVEDFTLVGATSRTISLTWELFPATFVTIAALLAVSAYRRELVSLVLVAFIALTPLTTAALAVATKTDVVFQLRYNLRSIPLVLVGLAWVWRSASPRVRPLVWLATAALLVVSVPSMWRLMQTYERQSLEQAFTRALTDGDQEGTRSLGSGTTIGVAPEREAAAWLLERVDRRDAVIADDEEAFAVMLFTGRPDLFADRIDAGERAWRELLENPFPRAGWILVAKHKPDRVRERYPRVLDGGVPWLERAFDNERWAIFRVLRRDPPA